MADTLHAFVTGQLLMKLRGDVADYRVRNGFDLCAATYFQVRRLLLVQPGWTLRTVPGPAVGEADFELSLKGQFRGLLRLDYLLRPGTPDWFPNEQLDARMAGLRAALSRRESGGLGQAWLIGLFDTGSDWLFPGEEMYGKQSCYWLPLNCRSLPKHDEWRARWDKLAR